MKAKKASAISAIALTVLLAGCGTNSTTTSTTSSPASAKETAAATATPAAKKVTITAQGFKPDQKEKNDQLDQRISRFKAKTPEC
ncbi:ABC-type glycerol-3-phosphate transport system substrate-binding protein [Paenibacillus sp. V4I9]|uniref:hypothetical protein n=1 Tax=Paenibacillus sp. V4I9 TaxID=3042308 RepID=UPI0027890D1C|nr:hypothetical protein [Paenibacillus sp. V4I9]MDQ0887028.1 ABC-type glycerol-3-phosphate transport system substrate-binding protein [Paenibacillus sp. V4I9]